MGSNDGDRDAEFRDDISNVYITPLPDFDLQRSNRLDPMFTHRYIESY